MSDEQSEEHNSAIWEKDSVEFLPIPVSDDESKRLKKINEEYQKQRERRLAGLEQ